MATPTISSVTTTGAAASEAVIAGTGFGASQGDSYVLFYPSSSGGFDLAPVISWAATSLTVTIPKPYVGEQGYFIVCIAGEQGVRSESFLILPEAPAAQTELTAGDIVFMRPGSMGVEAPR